MENPAISSNQHIPSFLQNSCPGTGAGEATAEDDSPRNCEGKDVFRPDLSDNGKVLKKSKSAVGGITCCVPECFSNSLRDPDLSYYIIPNGRSKEKQELRKGWLQMIARKNFDNPGQGHRVCSKHFIRGRKSYMNNIPTIVPKNKGKKEQKPRTTSKARNRSDNDLQNELLVLENMNLSTQATSSHVQDQEESEQEPGANMEKDLRDRIAQLELEKRRLEEANEELRQQQITMDATLKANNFSVHNLKDDPKLFRFYTGLPDYETFRIIFDSFGLAVNNLVYMGSNTNASKIQSADYTKRGPKRNLSAEQEFFLVLVRLRLGLLEVDIAHRAGIAISQFSRIWVTWLDFLHSKFRSYPIWPSKPSILKTMPNFFKESYPSTRVIIDCTEIYIEKPSSVRSQSATYSSYKHFNTAKGLLGITPAGAVSFVSDLYTGRTSDKKATQNSKLYALLENGDSVMADKGFDIENDLPEGVSL